MPGAPAISVIVPHYRDLERLDLCLAALERQTCPRGSFEIVVADNASPEGEAAIAVVIAGRARLITVTERGAGPARNGGVAASTGETLAFTDSDCVPEPAWLAEGVAALQRFDFVGGRVKVLVADERHMTGPEAFERVFAFDFDTYINRKGFTGSGNLFCPRALFDDVGGFRAAVSEDVEWSHRATAKGYRLGYAPLAIVGHPARRTWTELTAKWRKTNLETFNLTRQRPWGRLRWLGRNCLVPASAIVHSPRVLASRELTTPAQRARAIATLFALRLWRTADAMRILLQPERR
jgi:GT2 family glycosyltransferase